MNKKLIIFAVVLTAFLMLMTPCISAMNVQVVEKKLSEKIENINKILDDDDDFWLHWFAGVLSWLFAAVGTIFGTAIGGIIGNIISFVTLIIGMIGMAIAVITG